MGRPSKFTEARRQRILAMLAAGGSRRTAASVSGIGPATLTTWIRRGERVPGGQYGEFRRNVEEAESGTHRLVGLPTEDHDELTWAMGVLERGGGFGENDKALPEDGPKVITLKFPGEDE
jgi:hypothetical protein